MYRYETHMHTLPVSRCARYNVRENLEFYKSLGYDGIFITNHFLDGNINIDKTLSYEEKVEFYFSDYYEALELGKEIGIKVFLGVEISYRGTDFLIYGLDKEWFLAHPEIMDMKKSEELPFLALHDALVVQAHPYRQDRHIDHIRLFPHCIEGVETVNACRTELENRMADIFADAYGFVKTAGSDNHIASRLTHLAGMESDTPLVDEADFIRRVRNSEMKIFTLDI
ncbi:MAG: histidinol-phosphatase [Ruminococcaceae bacterium]|nr:histidinol-phosphatase [Oscillospiraceae bacterium]